MKNIRSYKMKYAGMEPSVRENRRHTVCAIVVVAGIVAMIFSFMLVFRGWPVRGLVALVVSGIVLTVAGVYEVDYYERYVWDDDYDGNDLFGE